MRIDDLTNPPEKKSLYLSRKVMNGEDIVTWAKEQGFETTLDPADMHVTVAYSDAEIDWEALGTSFETITIKKPDTRDIQLFDGGAVVLCLENADIARRWQQCMDNGASWSYPDYTPHVTITYGGIGDLIIEDIKPFTGNIKLGPEIFTKVNKGWKSKTKETDVNDAPEDDLPECFWFHPHKERYIECENHAEYVAHHARKMKLDVSDVADIVGEDGEEHISQIEADELCDYALDHGWVMGTRSRIRAANVSSLKAATTHFTEKWPGRNATLNVRDKFEVKASPEEIATFTGDGMLPESTDAANNLPTKFWLVFDIPKKDYSEEQAGRNAKIIEDIKLGRLHGVKGISDTREIVTQWLHVARNAALVMDAHAVAAVNNLKRIEYTNAEELCASNMKMLYRLFDKRYDRFGHQQLMQNLMGYVIRQMKDLDHNHHHQMSYYGFDSRVGYHYQEAIDKGQMTKIDTLADLCQFAYDAVIAVADEGGAWRSHLAKEFADLDKSILDQAVKAAVLTIGRMYSEEGEWIVANDPFIVPEDSILLMLHDAEMSQNYERLKADTTMAGTLNKYRFESHEGLMAVLEDGKLQSRYTVRFVDSDKFAKVRSVVTDRRSKARRG